ncbi:MAG: o-succinylbenzoate synthase [Bacteroidetes bacterium]|nr:o-succinylbenzoate synthase [Bacteroidota bacterium]
MKASFQPYSLIFKQPSGTSRGVLHTKETFILTIEKGNKIGIGECALFRGLSYDDVPGYKEKMQWLCDNINEDFGLLKSELLHFPSILFGLEQAILNLEQGSDIYFPSEFTSNQASIRINGLIWMGKVDFMKKQIEEKLSNGFSCIKLKIGINWVEEKKILQELRKIYLPSELEIRVDANGGFSPYEITQVLEDLANLEIHSIEQPIKKGNIEEMSRICKNPPIPIALDEELIGVLKYEEKMNLLKKINPQYIILKPALVGGFASCDEWISIAENLEIGWWITSALESNIGLNAIAQYTFSKNNKMPQGLGTGALFTNNFPTNLLLVEDKLYFKK